MRKLVDKVVNMFKQPQPVPPAMNRQERRARQSIARRKAKRLAREREAYGIRKEDL